jgi:hypothetical protein
MISRIKQILEYFIGEAGGVSFYITNSGTDDEDDLKYTRIKDDNLEEEVFHKKVKDGRIIYQVNDFKPEDTLDDSGRNTNLIKARLMARTPSANIKRKNSMAIRRKYVDKDR